MTGVQTCALPISGKLTFGYFNASSRTPPEYLSRLAGIELQEIEPKVWRSLRLPGSLTLARLHKVLQIVMGWTDTHLHEFKIGATHYGTPDPDFETTPTVRETRVLLADVLTPSVRRFLYSYDFGDGWQHSVHVEHTAELQSDEPPILCLSGANACPPEDVGGPYGYAEFRAIIANPEHPEHHDTLTWCGGAFDPTGFDLQAVNKRLRRLKA